MSGLHRFSASASPHFGLWGARHPEQLGAVENVFGWKLDEQPLKQICAIVREAVTDPVGPEFMAPLARRILPAA